jgi:photosystem II stability/assembly factor-like uncharacterized protein
VALATLSFLLAIHNPDRWQGIADPNEHPLAIVTDPHDARTVYLGSEQGHMLRSHDGGQTWVERHEGLPQTTPISALALLPDGTSLIAGVGDQVYLSADSGNTWRPTGHGLPAHTIIDTIIILPNGVALAGTASAGIYEARLDDFTWIPAATGLPARSDVYTLYDASDQGLLLAGLITGGVYVVARPGRCGTMGLGPLRARMTSMCLASSLSHVGKRHHRHQLACLSSLGPAAASIEVMMAACPGGLLRQTVELAARGGC